MLHLPPQYPLGPAGGRSVGAEVGKGLHPTSCTGPLPAPFSWGPGHSDSKPLWCPYPQATSPFSALAVTWSWSCIWGAQRHEAAGHGENRRRKCRPGMALCQSKRRPGMHQQWQKSHFWAMLRPSQMTFCFIRTVSFSLASQSYSFMALPMLPSVPQETIPSF